MLFPTIPCPADPNVHAPLNESSIDDDCIVLSADHVQQVAQFCDEIRLCKTDSEKYELCVRTRNELLNEHTGVQLLAAACEHIMLTQCTEYKDWKETREKPSTKPTTPGDMLMEHCRQP